MIRLSRIGRNKNPYFRVVLTDKRNAVNSGKFLEVLGFYAAKEGKFELNAERVKYWLSKGAKVTDTIHNFLVSKKVIDGRKINVLPRKSPVKKEKVPTTAT